MPLTNLLGPVGDLFYLISSMNTHFVNCYILHCCRWAAHNEKNTVNCDKCAKTFAIKADLSNMKFHDQPGLKCHICGLKNRKKQDHEDHVAIHTGAKEHKCKCGKVY